MITEMTEYAQHAVAMYTDEVWKQTGKHCKLSGAIRAPSQTQELKDLTAETGVYAHAALRFIGKYLYLCRLAAPQLGFAVCELARHASKWTGTAVTRATVAVGWILLMILIRSRLAIQ